MQSALWLVLLSLVLLSCQAETTRGPVNPAGDAAVEQETAQPLATPPPKETSTANVDLQPRAPKAYATTSDED